MHRLILGVFPGVIAAMGIVLVPSVATQDVPQEIKAPENDQVVLRVHAKGEQIYACREDVSGYIWDLKGPEAQLFGKDGKVAGKHFVGPSWEMNDGSRVTGKVAATAPSPNADSIPWLLLNVVSHEGNGVLSRVAAIQRLNTKGGKAPAAGCDSSHAGKEERVPYEADYVFWAPK